MNEEKGQTVKGWGGGVLERGRPGRARVPRVEMGGEGGKGESFEGGGGGGVVPCSANSRCHSPLGLGFNCEDEKY